MKGIVTILTERGQVSMPAALRKQLDVKPGQLLQWEQVSDDECRVLIVRHPRAIAAKVRAWIHKTLSGRFQLAKNDRRLDEIIARSLAPVNSLSGG
jgi:bifunctional DNA-binding transcriptional regulator/antitoxin component of YhaV-PrlF toxin-antitoxin module